ncbi:hypothetical protein ABT56_18905 [Photobacterium aquae]|uniref:Uncharacterized protein n=1 Tax=Photobacterium aquae TaxID=1195763 RepID=A0A0J1GUT5_9GAMM|nr:hypothetical protein [Photobacterium aquae]KLV03505.1 hypothetical protein ABT56_18905 [Photobacterium aquae]
MTRKQHYQLYKPSNIHWGESMEQYVTGKKAKQNKIKQFELLKKHMTPELFDFLASSIEIHVMADEFSLFRNNNIIYPCDSTLLDKLFNAKYDISNITILTYPAESFVMAMPSGYQFNGVHLPSFMVNVCDNKMADELIYQPFCKALMGDSHVLQSPPRDIDDIKISLCFKDRHSDGYVRVQFYQHEIPDLLAIDNIEQFKSYMDKVNQKHHDLYRRKQREANDIDMEIEIRLIKLVASLFVYHTASEGRFLRMGLPKSTAKFEQCQAVKNTPATFMELGLYRDTENANGTRPDTHERTFYFRQLMSERYYQGKHSNRVRGSRWVFVPATVVNQGLTKTILTQE